MGAGVGVGGVGHGGSEDGGVELLWVFDRWHCEEEALCPMF